MSSFSTLKLTRLSTQLALAGVLALSTIGLTACHGSKLDIVNCQGVPLNAPGPLNIDKGLCKKLGGGTPASVSCNNWSAAKADVITCTDPGSKLTAYQYPASEYIKCYGVAAASMNDCGTSKTACAGTVHVARQADAWIAIPEGLCTKIKGSVVAKVN
jgi:uncharacterized membrane protein